MSGVRCQVSGIRCQLKNKKTKNKQKLESGEANRWRVCYQRATPYSFSFLGFFVVGFFGIGATTRTSQKIQSLPKAGFVYFVSY